LILLIRHASAGRRHEWDGDDRLRPLDERGRRQARALAAQLSPYPIDRIVSSPYMRCVETVEPLALARGRAVEPRDELGEERQYRDARPFLESLAGEDVAVCTHGGVEHVLAGIDRYRKGQVVVLDDDLSPVRSIGPP
jgi:phosphohistidine phosphatase SixA